MISESGISCIVKRGAPHGLANRQGKSSRTQIFLKNRPRDTIPHRKVNSSKRTHNTCIQYGRGRDMKGCNLWNMAIIISKDTRARVHTIMRPKPKPKLKKIKFVYLEDRIIFNQVFINFFYNQTFRPVLELKTYLILPLSQNNSRIL